MKGAFEIEEFPLKRDFPSAGTRNRVDQIIDATHETAKANRGDAYQSNRVIWHHREELYLLYDLAAGVYDEETIEGYVFQCGVYCGGSACVLGSAIKDTNQHYKPVFATDIYKHSDPDPFLQQDVTNAYVESRLNQHKHDLTFHLYFGVGDDLFFLRQFWKPPIRLAFVDSSHSYHHTQAEIYALLPFISVGGYLVFHDYFREHEGPIGVLRAVNEFFNDYKDRRFEAFNFNDRLLIVKLFERLTSEKI